MEKNIKQEVAIALLLLKDWKCQVTNSLDWVDVTRHVFDIAIELGVMDEVNEMLSKFPKMRITECT